MSNLPRLLEWLWAVSFLAQVFLFVSLFLQGNFRRLPAFTAYVTLNICQVGVLLVLYRRVGFDVPTADAVAWLSEAATIVAKAIAVMELCRRILRPYQGIWALGWRVLLGSAGVVLFFAGIATGGNWRLATLEAQRGLQLAIAVALVVLLLAVRYYSVPVLPALKSTVLGFCIHSCFVVLNNSVLEQWLRDYAMLWNVTGLVAFLAAVLIWTRALWHPLPAFENQLSFLSPDLYDESCSAIHVRLRQLNDRLATIFKVQGVSRS